MLGEHWFKGYPGVGMLTNKIGLVAAHPANAQRLLGDEGRLVLVFPEGQKGSRKLYWQRYRLRRFGRGGFVRTAMRAGVPIVPVAVMGAEEAMPIFAHVPLLQRLTGLIYFPVNHAFPHFGLAAALMYLPAKFKIRFLEPVDLSGYGARGRGRTWRWCRRSPRRSARASRPSSTRWSGARRRSGSASAAGNRRGAGPGWVRVGPAMGARRLATLAIAALLVAGCGDEDFENKPRPAVPVELTGVIQEDKLTVSPSQGRRRPGRRSRSPTRPTTAHTITLEGESITEEVGPVQPLDTAAIQRTLEPGQLRGAGGLREGGTQGDRAGRARHRQGPRQLERRAAAARRARAPAGPRRPRAPWRARPPAGAPARRSPAGGRARARPSPPTSS